ncbi:restriction endonuclease PLD domain-containing protein [Bacillus coahuilensis]|uniref:restriction endonuclease PLD domain-containing protein n=1 Tax=Bacillus coahuilensis TaxID=408580 RepID=UPI0007518D4B|nr:restriction endonuclease PLD domain-containing protein [Bacillus coahuilensis]
MFFDRQSHSQQREYVDMLRVVGSLSNLFSESTTPYLYYRAAENIFCRAFRANNLSRGDISFDAYKGNIGIGLKTFMHGNGRKYEKVAEFNRDIDRFRGEDPREIIRVISYLRNERLLATLRAHNTTEMIYHIVTRKEGIFEIHEEEMHLIDFDTLQFDRGKTTDKNIFFRDRHAEYKFYIAKSTLYKKFITEDPLASFEVEILDDPFDFLLKEQASSHYMVHEQEEQFESIVLPLYSAKSGRVEERSGLNQWYARGRVRHVDEVYIPIPKWIHRQFEGFFPYNRHTDEKGSFNLILPNNDVLLASICQSGGKGFMSNPNKDLGNWILRTVLQIPPHHLVTNDDLDRIGIDSVIVTKIQEDLFRINFATTGTYEEFEEEFKS